MPFEIFSDENHIMEEKLQKPKLLREDEVEHDMMLARRRFAIDKRIKSIVQFKKMQELCYVCDKRRVNTSNYYLCSICEHRYCTSCAEETVLKYYKLNKSDELLKCFNCDPLGDQLHDDSDSDNEDIDEEDEDMDSKKTKVKFTGDKVEEKKEESQK